MNYYVSTSGNDSNDGLSVETAWRTIQHGLDNIPAGTSEGWTKLIIEAGTYNERACNTAGKDYVHVEGDVSGKFFGKPGVVELYYESTSTSIAIFTFYGSLDTEEKLLIVENIRVRSNNRNYLRGFISNRKCQYIQCSGISLYRCWYSSQNYYCKDCVTIDTSGGFMYINEVIGCISIFSTFGAYSNTVMKNYIALFCLYGYRAGGATENCVMLGCQYGQRYGTAYNGFFAGVYATDSTTVRNVLRLGMAGNGYYYDETGARSDVNNIRLDNIPGNVWGKIIEFIKIFKPDFPGQDKGALVDIEGLPYSDFDGGYSIGNSRRNDIVEGSSLNIILNQASIKLIDLPLKGGVETTLTCSISSSGTATRPQLCVYDAGNNLITSDTAESDEDTLSVSVTPEHDYVYRVWLYARDSSVGAYTTFSNIQINGVQGVINANGEIYPVIARMDDVITEIVPEGSFFQIYIRSQAAYTQPTDAAEWADLLATFTQLGPMELKSSQLLVEPELIQVEDGNQKAVYYRIEFQAKDLNYSVENLEAYIDNWDNQHCDILVYVTNQNMAIVLPSIVIHCHEHSNDGDVSYIELKADKKGKTKDDLRDVFSVPE